MGIFLGGTPAGAAHEGAAGATGMLQWGRLAVALVLLLALLGGAIGTARGGDYAQVHGVLVHSFELMLGAVVGILTGEAAHT